MLQPAKFLAKTLSVRLSLNVVSAVALLFVVALLAMYWYTRGIVKEEVLQKATQTLEATVQHMDNMLYDVEHVARNMRWNVEHHLDQPDLMFTYSKKVLELNPNISGCAIAFEPYYYRDRGQYFMSYYYRKPAGGSDGETTVVQSDFFGHSPYR